MLGAERPTSLPNTRSSRRRKEHSHDRQKHKMARDEYQRSFGKHEQHRDLIKMLRLGRLMPHEARCRLQSLFGGIYDDALYVITLLTL